MEKKILLASLILLTPGLLPAADDGRWMPVADEGKDSAGSVPVWSAKRAALVDDSPALTRLRGMLLTADPAKEDAPPAKLSKRVMETAVKNTETALVIEWLGGDPVKDFSRAWKAGGKETRSTYRVGSTTVTRTVLASAGDDAVVIHLLADQPGALSFRVSIPADGVKREDRRQLIATPETGPASHVWVIPFESDVEPDGNGVTVRGEGEAIIVWSFSPDKTGAAELAGTWKRLAERHDPGHNPPDVTKIWHGVAEEHRKSPENSP